MECFPPNCLGTLKNKYNFQEIKSGLQNLIATKNPVYSLEDGPCKKCGGNNILQETDTFDTWFMSGQWPLTTLGYPDSKDFKYFYPTSVLDTMWDILFFWVARMMMFGLYFTKKAPFKVIYLHSRVVDEKGQKMSKSKGNVIDPMLMVEKYGADALRMALVFGASPGSDIRINDDKMRAMRNFSNKIWNAARFVLAINPGQIENVSTTKIIKTKHRDDRWILKELKKSNLKITKFIESYRFDLGAQEIYHFFWHAFCDKYIEMSKERKEEAYPILLYVLKESLALLHPFIPFITEEIYQSLPIKNKKECLMVEDWPK
ncbi:MAG: class I tRNA ligase family protein [Candidatus Nealsonbacteria bacterium]|nr:class I tRNA ligase family protein [Candidatus Nealsonbacteria bacterium]